MKEVLGAEPQTDLIEIDRGKPFDQDRFHAQNFTLHHHKNVENVLHVRLSDTKFMQAENVHGQRLAHLDAKVFEALWGSREKLPQFWQGLLPLGQSFFQFYFFGTVLRNIQEVDHVLYMRWAQEANVAGTVWKWFWGITPITYDWGYPFPSLIVSTND